MKKCIALGIFGLLFHHAEAQKACLFVPEVPQAKKSIPFRAELWQGETLITTFFGQTGDTLCGTPPKGVYQLKVYSHDMLYSAQRTVEWKNAGGLVLEIHMKATSMENPTYQVQYSSEIPMGFEGEISEEIPALSRSESPRLSKNMSEAGSDFSSSEITATGAASGAGTLTALEVNDFVHWDFWSVKALDSLRKHLARWNMFPKQKFGAQLINRQGQPLVDVEIGLENAKGHRLWTAHTDNTGKAELWADFFSAALHMQQELFLVAKKESFELKRKVNANPERYRKLVVDLPCPTPPNAVDIAFVVDATGSMSDELGYLQTELEDVMHRAATRHSQLEFRTAAVVYRDRTDAYLTRHEDFKPGAGASSFLKNQSAGGGGDFPEALDQGLRVGLQQLSWRSDARSRILFLVLDAPAHQDQETVLRLQALTSEAAARGIRIVPLACSGMDESAEFLARAMALATNGTYTALTDESGVGNAHRTPVAGKVDKDKLNSLLLQIIDRFVYVPPCPDLPQNQNDSLITESHMERLLETPGGQKTEPNDLEMTLFPNPTEGPLSITWKGNYTPGKIYILDLQGRLWFSYETGPGKRFRTDDAYALSRGLYFAVYESGNRRIVKRFIRS